MTHRECRPVGSLMLIRDHEASPIPGGTADGAAFEATPTACSEK